MKHAFNIFVVVASIVVIAIGVIAFWPDGEKSGELKQLEGTVVERDGQIEQLEGTVAERGRQIEQLEETGKPAPAGAFTNTLGMVFKPVPGTEVQFCIWETRVKDYAAYASANAGVDENWRKPRHGNTVFIQTDTHPVLFGSWEDARAFCAWLTQKERAEGKIKAGQRYRLPTDAEWSVAVGLGRETGVTPKAKNGGIKDVYPWGNTWPPPKRAGNYLQSLKVDNFDYTSPVGSFAANTQGLHDMGGSVREWCEDWFDPAKKQFRVLRGSSWVGSVARFLLSSGRIGDSPDKRCNFFGFRCVLTDGSGR
jgi:hypothetical protein